MADVIDLQEIQASSSLFVGSAADVCIEALHWCTRPFAPFINNKFTHFSLFTFWEKTSALCLQQSIDLHRKYPGCEQQKLSNNKQLIGYQHLFTEYACTEYPRCPRKTDIIQAVGGSWLEVTKS